MLINITGTGDKRALIVSEGDEVLFEKRDISLHDAHKLAKIGLKSGWDAPELVKK